MTSPDLSSLPELQGATVYRLGEAIATGGMGAVLKAEDVKVQREVAMKVLLADRGQNADALKRFLQEARVLGHLEHPNIVPLYELGLNEQGQPFYTMKLVKGVTLRAVLEALRAGDDAVQAKYPLNQLLTIFQKVCDAISFAHARGIIHRDLKPDNIMLGDFGEVLVMDWGLAKILAAHEGGPSPAAMARFEEWLHTSAHDGEAMRTQEGAVMGTPHFMAPEQAEGRVNDLDARTDIFALGGILYNLLTLRPPVTGNTIEEVLENIVTGCIAPPAFYNQYKTTTLTAPVPASATALVEPVNLRHCPHGRIPEALSAVVMKALAVDPAQRYQSVAELKRDLTAYQNGFPTTAEEAGRLRQLRLLIARHKTLAAAAALVVMLTTFFVVQLLASERTARASLSRLRETAPTFYEQAGLLIESGQLPDALEKIDFALTLTPDAPRFLQLRANILQTMQRLAEARVVYERVIELEPTNHLAAQNFELCAKLKKETAGGKEWPMATLNAFQKTLDDQGRFGEAVYLNRFLGRDSAALTETWKAKLKAAGLRPSRFVLLPNRRFDVSFANQPVDDLSPLKGMPIEVLQIWQTKVVSLGPLQGMTPSSLNCARTRISSVEPLREMPLTLLDLASTEVSDLAPLQGLPLVSLNLSHTRVADLGPLAGMPLTWLNLEATGVTNLAPIAGAPLKYLNLDGTAITDLAPLAGSPVKGLDLRRVTGITSLAPLRECKLIESLGLPPVVTDYPVLRQLPTLRIVEHEVDGKLVRESVNDFFRRLETTSRPPPKKGK